MTDSKAKGARAEAQAVELLNRHTGVEWRRTPFSGALDAVHGLKGDVYIPGKINNFCVEVKHYADDKLTSQILTGTSPTLFAWWDQATTQAFNTNKEPLLLFKHDRSKWFAATLRKPTKVSRYIFISTDELNMYICLAEELLDKEKPKFYEGI